MINVWAVWAPLWAAALADRQNRPSPPPMRRSHERIEVPPPPRLPSLGPSNNKLLALGSLVVALANAPAFINWATPKDHGPPAATKDDIAALRTDMRSMQLTLDELRKENDGRLRQLERVTDRLEAMRGITVSGRSVE